MRWYGIIPWATERKRERERERERERARARVWCIEMALKEEENRILEFHCLKWEQLLKVWSTRGERGEPWYLRFSSSFDQ